ncbi:hypothetical protein [Paraburkholderia nemoris]|uniref:hypothetical protein n=1 Tax=Paraburkholderia nemoris TaxID=2793076 RepID=UPI001B2A160E|nr:hypothetical protein [Paraburkholderia nemoris]CAE6724396.1 hypothetical protein LMG22931_01886 [Paraburkholderia nemoris]
MDIIAILRKKISLLDSGEHSAGLKATLSHIETAFRHLMRGQKDADQTAFTDAVYRTNQAFEGAIKEAYRVITKKNPENVRPYDIESHFSKSGTFRRRVLDQFTNYRKEWRNPSTHDYKLDFNDNEAFLAIVSVTAFSCLLLDEIAQRLAHDKEVAAVHKMAENIRRETGAVNGDLLTSIVETLKIYFLRHTKEKVEKGTAAQWLGSVNGFLAEIIPDATITAGAPLGTDKLHVTADLLVERGSERVVVEIKNRINILTYKGVIDQVEHLMLTSGISDGVIFFLPTILNTGKIYEAERILFDGIGRLRTISPIAISHGAQPHSPRSPEAGR